MMVKRIISTLLIFAMCLSMSACTSKESQKVEKEKQYDPEKLVEEALENMAKEEIKSVAVKTVNSYDNGTEDTEELSFVYDTKKQLIESRTMDEYGEELYLHSFYQKENDKYVVYVKDNYNRSGWVRYEEEVEEDEESDFETNAAEFDIPVSEENGFSEISYSYEGEEQLDDIDTLKVKISAKEVFDSGIEEVVKITRNELLKEYGWSEKEVQAIDGFSEIVDAYVDAFNRKEGESVMDTVYTVWIDASSHQLLRVRMEQDIESAVDEPVKKATQDFNNSYWKMDMLQYHMKQNGKTLEEAKKIVKESENGALGKEKIDSLEEGSDQAEQKEEENQLVEDYESVIKTVVTRRFKVGEEAQEIGELPSDYESMTMDEYYSIGFEEYFQ